MDRWAFDVDRLSHRIKGNLGRMKTVLFTVFALTAFAANSVFCRLALGAATIDAASFTTLRLASGAGLLLLMTAALLRGLTAMRAATVQLAVPVLAAAGGVIFLSEQVSLRLFLSAVVILGGVGLALAGRQVSVHTKIIKRE